ncbi:hypothetical protein WHR41_01107 [Cladosporium halotolerans]|uniref:Metallo-beta-lactamase domain-containing protein n=1 Tax=Cladosporium halotolerans TaxID=1052096 RepID=A0AB34KYE4_9PEZI
MSSGTNILARASVPAFLCPPGTKVHILNLGTMRVDAGWLLRGANSSSASNSNPENQGRDLIIAAALIEHPHMGLILFETGCAEDVEIEWGAPLTDLFPRTVYTEAMKLPNVIKATGNDIKDVKAIIMGHLHLDHAGGLEHFFGTNVPIYVHEEEFKHAAWSVATNADSGVYLASYLSLTALNWQTFSASPFHLCQGLTLHHSPGHTPGLCLLQINLARDGTFLFTTDQYHVRENYEDAKPQGWLARDHNAWVHSHQMVRNLVELFGARLVFGHDMETVRALTAEKGILE